MGWGRGCWKRGQREISKKTGRKSDLKEKIWVNGGERGVGKEVEVVWRGR